MARGCAVDARLQNVTEWLQIELHSVNLCPSESQGALPKGQGSVWGCSSEQPCARPLPVLQMPNVKHMSHNHHLGRSGHAELHLTFILLTSSRGRCICLVVTKSRAESFIPNRENKSQLTSLKFFPLSSFILFVFQHVYNFSGIIITECFCDD